MPTVIDSLVVEVGLDPAKYRKGQKEIADADSKTREQLLKTGKGIEEQSKKSGESILALKNNVLGLFAAFTGVGATAFLTQLVHADAVTGRVAKTMSMSTKTLQEWQGAAELAGGSAQDLVGGFQSLTNALEEARATGDRAGLQYKFMSLFNFDGKGGIDIVDRRTGKMKDAVELYLEMVKKLEGVDPKRATFALLTAGVPQSLIPMLLQGNDLLQKSLATMRDIGVATDEDSAAAVRYESSLTKLWLRTKAFGRLFYTPGTAIADILTTFLSPSGTGEQVDALGNVVPGNLGPSGVSNSNEQKKTAKSQVGLSGAFTSQEEKEAFIRSEAAKRKINPDIAVAVAKKEGFYKFAGDQNTSFGAFQLHYKNNIPGLSNAGLGDTFTKKTGLDARDPKNERAGIQFALDQAAFGGSGWAPWHGWTGAQFAGISSDNSRSSSSKTEAHITVNVYAQSGDVDSIGKGISSAIKRNLYTQQAAEGPV